MPYDNQIKKEETEQIAKQCRTLIEINSYLGDYIMISGKTIS